MLSAMSAPEGQAAAREHFHKLVSRSDVCRAGAQQLLPQHKQASVGVQRRLNDNKQVRSQLCFCSG